jgi:hypothetical protein
VLFHTLRNVVPLVEILFNFFLDLIAVPVITDKSTVFIDFSAGRKRVDLIFSDLEIVSLIRHRIFLEDVISTASSSIKQLETIGLIRIIAIETIESACHGVPNIGIDLRVVLLAKPERDDINVVGTLEVSPSFEPDKKLSDTRAPVGWTFGSLNED